MAEQLITLDLYETIEGNAHAIFFSLQESPALNVEPELMAQDASVEKTQANFYGHPDGKEFQN